MKEQTSNKLTEHTCREKQELCRDCLKTIIQGKIQRALIYSKSLQQARGSSSKMIH
jgi:hypothetical protein